MSIIKLPGMIIKGEQESPVYGTLLLARQAKKNINLAVKKAASQLHHTANVSKKSYMDNEIITLYIDNPLKFKRLVESHRKQNGNLPTISRLLNLIIISIKG